MKRFFILSLLFVVFTIVICVGVIFVKLTLILNPHNLAWILKKTHVFELWSWKNARFSHVRKNLFHRNFEGELQDFCFVYHKPTLRYETCFEKISWNFDVVLNFKKGIFAQTLKPLFVKSSFTKVDLWKLQESSSTSAPPDLRKYWHMLWHPLVPDMNIDLQNFDLKSEKAVYELYVTLLKEDRDLRIEISDFLLKADPGKFTITSTREFPLTKLIQKKNKLYFSDLHLVGKFEKKGVSLDLTGELNSVQFLVGSFLSLPLKGEFTSVAFLKDFLLHTTGEVRFMKVKENIEKLSPPPYNSLPAPLNVLDGVIIAQFEILESAKNVVNILMDTGIKLRSKGQVVDIDIRGLLPFDVLLKSIGTAKIGIAFNQLKLNLPDFSKKALIPQMKADDRFKTHDEILKPKAKMAMFPLLHLTAKNEKSLIIASNLLDEELKLNFDLQIGNEGISNGYLNVLPLKTTILKRVIKVQNLHVKFEAPMVPVIESVVQFPLPEYKITMFLEGPISKPRYSFRSEPPLNESDIFAVLIYGRPLENLDASDRSSASKSSQILSQGVASLTTLYLLSGTPIEYVGYDQEKKSAFAQIGLGDKSSLRVGGGKDGVNSTDIRRSLGKGWFLDTSVQDTNTGVNTERSQDFGVMLERIISY